jgi:hypothetical protein
VIVAGRVVLTYRYRLHDTTGDDLGTVRTSCDALGDALGYSSAARTPSSFIEEVRGRRSRGGGEAQDRGARLKAGG